MTAFNAMITYSTSLMSAISEWLSAEPMIYIFGVLVGCFVINTILSLITFRR